MTLINKLISSSSDPWYSTLWLKPTILALSPTTSSLWPCASATLGCSTFSYKLCIILPQTSFLFLCLLWLPCSSPRFKILTNSTSFASRVISLMKPPCWLFFLQSNMISSTLNVYGIILWVLCCFYSLFESRLIEVGRASQALQNIHTPFPNLPRHYASHYIDF